MKNIAEYGCSRGVYQTSKKHRETCQKYKAKKDNIRIQTPKGTRERLSNAGDRQEILNTIIERYISEQEQNQ